MLTAKTLKNALFSFFSQPGTNKYNGEIFETDEKYYIQTVPKAPAWQHFQCTLVLQ